MRLKVNASRIPPRVPTIHAQSATGTTQLEAREVDIDATMASGRLRKAEMLVLFDPTSGLFGWLFGIQTGNGPGGEAALFELQQMAVYANRDVLTLFHLTAPTLNLTRFRKRAETVEDAVSKALEEAPAALQGYEARVRPHVWEKVSLAPALEDAFWRFPLSAVNTLARLQMIEQAGPGWAITIKCEWVARVVLSDKLEVLSVTKETH